MKAVILDYTVRHNNSLDRSPDESGCFASSVVRSRCIGIA